MADYQKDNGLSMEEYFNEGLTGEPEMENPFEPATKETHHASASGKRSLLSRDRRGKGKSDPKRLRRIGICAGAAALVILIISIAAFLAHRRNDGIRHTEKFAKLLGQPMATAQNSGSLDVSGKSAYPAVTGMMPAGSYTAESRRKCKVEGVHLPEWSIILSPQAEQLGAVTYYHYELLEDDMLGKKRKSYLDPASVPQGADPERTEDALGLSPYSISYLADGTQVRTYRYYFVDGETKDCTSYIITASWNAAGVLSDISDERLDYIGSILQPKS